MNRERGSRAAQISGSAGDVVKSSYRGSIRAAGESGPDSGSANFTVGADKAGPTSERTGKKCEQQSCGKPESHLGY